MGGPREERYEGIELLRIVSMLMIIAIHILGKGGLFDSAKFGSIQNIVLVLIKSFAVASVNCYVLISGYFLAGKQFKCTRITRTVLQVLEYSVIIALICFLTKSAPITSKNILFAICPIPMQDTYWFATQYVSLLLLSPILNRLIGALTRDQHRIIIVIFLILFCLVPTFTFIKKTFYSSGNDIVWFCTLYLIASYLNKYEILSKKKNLVFLFAGGGITSACYYLVGLLTKSITGDVGDFANSFFTYNSPFVLMTSLGLFGLFLGIRVKNPKVKSFINIVGKQTFGVYLLHNHFLFREIIWAWLAPVHWVDYNLFIMIGLFLISMVGIFIIGVIVELFRSSIGKIVLRNKRHSKLAEKIDTKINILL